MQKMMTAMLVSSLALFVGCSSTAENVSAPPPPPVEMAAQTKPAHAGAQTQTVQTVAQTRPAEPAVPAESEVCLKPADASGITIDLHKPGGGHSAFRTQPGWSVASPAGELQGSVNFPEPVMLWNATVTVEPVGRWKVSAATPSERGISSASTRLRTGPNPAGANGRRS